MKLSDKLTVLAAILFAALLPCSGVASPMFFGLNQAASTAALAFGGVAGNNSSFGGLIGSLTITTSVLIPSNSEIVVAYDSDFSTSSPLISAISDGTNTYSLATGVTASSCSCQFGLAFAGSGLASGSTITVTFSTTSVMNARIVVYWVANASSGTQPDAQTSASGTAPIVMSLTSVAAKTILFAVGAASDGPPPTFPSGWTVGESGYGSCYFPTPVAPGATSITFSGFDTTNTCASAISVH